MIFKIMKFPAPAYLNSMLKSVSDVSSHMMTRRTSTDNLYLPRLLSELYKNSLAYSGVKLDDNLPGLIKQDTSIVSFKSLYFKEYFM